MILEALLALSLSQVPVIHTPPVFAASFSSSRSSSSFPSGRSYSSPSRSFSSPSYSPSRSFSSPSRPSSLPSRSPSYSFSSPSRPTSSPSLRPPPKPSTATPVVSTPSVQRINKQTAVAPSIPARPAPAISSSTPKTAPPIIRVPQSTQPRVMGRETYVERYHDGGIAGNPFFWLWALDNNRNNSQPQQQQPTQVLVQNSDGEQVKVPASQLVVQGNTWSPVREFFVFLLGGGVGVGGLVFLARPVLSRR